MNKINIFVSGICYLNVIMKVERKIENSENLWILRK